MYTEIANCGRLVALEHLSELYAKYCSVEAAIVRANVSITASLVPACLAKSANPINFLIPTLHLEKRKNAFNIAKYQ